VTGTTREFDRLSDLRREVTLARIYGGLHFREAMQDGERLGRRTTRFVLLKLLRRGARLSLTGSRA
jgi:hypothetical protein